jgi:Mu-like prophage protein Com
MNTITRSKLNITPVHARVQGKDVRCGAPNCNRKLGEFVQCDGEIKCSKCGSINEVKVG